MRNVMFTLLGCLFLFSSVSAEEFKSIRDFTYKGISFSSSMDDLKAKGFSCKEKNCVIGEDFFVYSPAGIFSDDQFARNGKTVTFHEDHPLKIIIDQLYPDTGEECSGIIKDIQTRFNDTYKADITFRTYPSRYGSVTDYDTLLGSVKLGEDVLRVDFSCNKIQNPKTSERLTFIHALFHYENLASRLLIDDI